MILRALYDLYDRLAGEPEYDVAPLHKSYQKVTFVVVLDGDGKLVDIQDARLPADGKKRPRRVLVLGDTKSPGAGLNPCFLWDTPGYLLGWDPDNPGRAARTFEAFRDRHLREEKEIGTAEFSAVCRFLEGWKPNRAAQYPVLEEVQSGYGVFQIRGSRRFVHEDPGIVAWWESQRAAAGGGPQGQCLITGETAPIARTHAKLKGIAGSQPSGATIAGFNDSAYWSYGLQQSYNSPVSEDAAHRYTTALNALLDGPRRERHRMVVGGTTVAFWTEKPTATEDIFAAFAAGGSDALVSAEAQDPTVRAKLEAFLRALRQGREAYGELEGRPEGTGYFILGLAAPTPARIAIRFFHQGTLAELLENLRRHHRDIGIERKFGEGSRRPEPEFPSTWFLLRETAPPGGEIPAVLSGKLLESIVTGAPYPEALLATIMRRVAAGESVNYAKACIIKGCLVRNKSKEVSMSIDTERREPSYRLGRLFAALEKTQQDALGGGIGATIRDRFYASASATPAIVFPRLLRTYQHHLAKLEGGNKVSREKLVQDIVEPLAEMPSHLSLADQGLFALGYYHQMNDFYKRHETNAE